MSAPGWLGEPDLELPGVWVTVAAVRGSAPREPGAAMWVGGRSVAGSIGGGGLERAATEHARSRLSGAAAADELIRYPLGLAFGQCCGGVALLHFQLVNDPEAAPWRRAVRAMVTGEPAVRVALAGRPGGPMLVALDGTVGNLGDRLVEGHAQALAAAMLRGHGPDMKLCTADGAESCGLGDGPVLILQRLRPVDFHIALFGAGHVGRALVRVLADHPCRIVWVDSREAEFPDSIPPNTARRCVAEPTAVVPALPAGCFHLVMTHSHALDLDLCERILLREDSRFCGLIGSISKRNNFRRRLTGRGLGAAHLERLTCPVGVPGVRNKHPSAIAIAVAAQLLQLRENDTVEERDHGVQRVRGTPIQPCTTP